MSKGKIEVEEHQWAQKVFNLFSWKFDDLDGDPTPAKIAEHCKLKNESYKKALKAYDTQEQALTKQAQSDTFVSLYKNCTDRISGVDSHLKDGDIADANSALDEVEACLEAIGSLFGTRSSGKKESVRDDPKFATCLARLNEQAKNFSSYKSKRNELHTPEQEELFDELYKQTVWLEREAAKELQGGHLERTDDLLFQVEANLQGLENITRAGKQQTVGLNTARANIKDAKARINAAYKLRKTISDKKLRKEFEERYKQAKNDIKAAEKLIKQEKTEEAQPVLASVSASVEQVEYAVGTNTWAPLDAKYSRSTKFHKTEIQSYYQQINTIADKAAKREFEAHYQRAINQIADLEVLIEGEGRAAEEKVKNDIAALEQEIQSLENCLVDAITKANAPDTSNQTLTQSPHLQSKPEECSAQHQKLMDRINKLLSQHSVIQDQKLLEDYATYKMLAEQMDSQVSDLLQRNYVNDARAQLTALEGLANNLQACIDQAIALKAQNDHEPNKEKPPERAGEHSANENKKASDYKDILKNARATHQQLITQKSKIIDPEKLKEFNLLMQQIDKATVLLGDTLSHAKSDSLEKADLLSRELQAVLPKAQVIIDEVLLAAAERAKEPKRKKIKYKNSAKGVRNNVDAREKPSGPNPEFYCEVQDGQFCLKHAMNACLGFGAISVQDMEDGLLQANVEGFKTQTETQLFSELNGYYPELTLQEMRKQIKADPDKLYRNAAKAQFGMLFDGQAPAEIIRANGSEPTMGLAIVNGKQKELGLPEFKNTWLEKPKSGADIQANVEKVKEITEKNGADRLVIGAGGHFIALRKNAEDEWFEVDSLEDGSKRIDLEDYIKTQSARHKNEALSILHFDEELTYKKAE
ncbi:hypothetical protein PsAD2_01547 [Pseudovibrio axinellae]|uniref:Uncharacterized protein n=1 Tax=Pseudovibrio axinellae TaxID=989403 RepID=A0A165ZMG5_9HYPH|nr:hypothetical protein [Pseudovibrio axinellae]KZL20061.1 hypothetical protein PsAD2_01547 [Pseudovibrio axinellae]SEQ27098.1 hypothetical protein SAMN05421798_102290 [Pseudovibrio axinellae]